MTKISCYFSCNKAMLLSICVWFLVLGRSWCSPVVVKREERATLVSTEYGEISAARVADHINGSYLLHFFTLDPNSLFLPVILHANMVFYVHTGSGKLRWREENEVKSTDLRRGDVHRLEEGSIFLIQSNLDTESERQKLRIHAIFPNSIPEIGPYSSIRDMLLGFDNKVLQVAFKVPAEKIEELVNGTKPPAIVHSLSSSTTKNRAWEMESRFVESLGGGTISNIFELNKKKKEKKKGGTKLYNLFNEDKDFENCNGWSTTATGKKMHALVGTDISLFMVNLTEGSMMGPHWNPTATEIAVVLQGWGMVRVVCPGNSSETGCRDMRYEVREGDTFVVPRFHGMAQMAFNNETLVFMGFAASAKRNHPQYLAGKASVLRTLDKDVLAVAFNVTNTTMDQLVNSQEDSVILSCVSCAEEEFKVVEEEREREKAAEREREAEEERKREEERKAEEEKKREEERRREEEEERKREEEEAKKQEEERERREEEEERKRREEEAERKAEEEEARKREEEAARKAEEERKQKEEEEEEEEARKREEEAAREAEEERKRKEEEEEEEKEREEEEAREREEEEERKRQKEEEEKERREDEERKREEEAAAARREDEKERKAEEEREEEVATREEEKRRRREEEEEEEEEAAASRRREEEEEGEGERADEEAPASWRHVMKTRLKKKGLTGHAHSKGRF